MVDVSAAELGRLSAMTRKRARERRKLAVGTMSPDAIRRAVLRGQIDPAEALLWGEGPDGPFGLNDVIAFSKASKKLEEKFRGKKREDKRTGVTIAELVAASLPDDIERANSQIRNVSIYKIDGATIHIRTNASEGSEDTHHFLRVRISNWTSEMAAGRKSYRAAVNNALRGPVQFDCDCGRHQYWFRYVATIAGAALAPIEKDFPKIRNPKLAGMCCKHTLSSFKRLFSPMAVTVLSQAMERQASANGFADDVGRVTVTPEMIKRLADGTARPIEQKAFIDSLQRRARSAMASKKKDPAYVRKLEREVARLKKQLQKGAGSIDNNAQLRQQLQTELDRAAMYGGTREAAIKFFANDKGLPISRVEAMAKEL